ncbi:MAG TPA: Holliday junction resolvase RuvX [Actinomycetota bacterium]|nr:Holliday junction resolvase RuvX [Actinomycetota bacterium]
MPDDRPPEAPKGPVLGLDLGQSRIGVAISDPGRRMAVALGTIRTGAPEDVKAIAALVKEHGVSQIVVGHPLSLSGESGEAAEHAERFAEALRGFLGTSVVLHDERLSTVEAARGLSDAGVDRRRRRDVIDQAAAVVILQSYLDGLYSLPD